MYDFPGRLMKAVIIPDSTVKDRILPFYLAAEEWVAANLPAGDWFFAWQVSPTVICGRHQDMPLEVDLTYAAAHGIEVWRRKSGGGCVYADSHNIMFSFITGAQDVQGSFGSYTSHICRMLSTLGIAASPTGRNDVAIDGHKVAGNAFYRASGRSIVHGTMLYDADFETMSRVLTPSRAKLMSKGVQSVPARVTTLRAAGLAISCHEFISHAVATLCPDGAYTLSDTDVTAVEDIMQSYLSPDFLRREGLAPLPRGNTRRFEGIGEVSVRWVPSPDGRIDRVNISGDFFGCDSDVRRLEHALAGVSATSRDVIAALTHLDIGRAVEGLTPENVAALLLDT